MGNSFKPFGRLAGGLVMVMLWLSGWCRCRCRLFPFSSSAIPLINWPLMKNGVATSTRQTRPIDENSLWSGTPFAQRCRAIMRFDFAQTWHYANNASGLSLSNDCALCLSVVVSSALAWFFRSQMVCCLVLRKNSSSFSQANGKTPLYFSFHINNFECIFILLFFL